MKAYKRFSHLCIRLSRELHFPLSVSFVHSQVSFFFLFLVLSFLTLTKQVCSKGNSLTIF